MFSVYLVFVLFFRLFRAEEMANNFSQQLEDERNRRVAAVEAFKIIDQSTQDLRHKLEKEEKARKSVDSALEST